MRSLSMAIVSATTTAPMMSVSLVLHCRNVAKRGEARRSEAKRREAKRHEAERREA